MRVTAIGLTGGIGSGKSTVSAFFVEAGCHLVDTDAIARSLTAPGGAALPRLAEAFGSDILDATGALDRNKMRERAFADQRTRRRLESVLHPMIGDEARRQAAAAGSAPVLYDVPLLAESAHWRGRVQRVLVVDCDEATQRQRVMQRSGWSEEMVQRVLAQQASRAQRRAIADAVIHNQGLTVAQLQSEVQRLVHLWGCGAVEQ